MQPSQKYLHTLRNYESKSTPILKVNGQFFFELLRLKFRKLTGIERRGITLRRYRYIPAKSEIQRIFYKLPDETKIFKKSTL